MNDLASNLDELKNTYGSGIAEQCIARNEEPKQTGWCKAGRIWKFSDGTRVVQTNGDPVWDHDDGFDELIVD